MDQGVNRFEPGEIVYITDTDQVMMWSEKGEWIEIRKDAIENNIPKEIDTGMTVYDLNKTIISQLQPKSALELQPCISIINQYHDQHNSEFYLLLCKEISYYTIFAMRDPTFLTDFPSLGSAAVSCAQDIGQIVSVDPSSENDAVEIWVRSPEGDKCMYLFDATGFVVTCG